MSHFEDRIARGLQRVRQFAGNQVTYRRGAQSATVTAVTGQTEFDTLDDNGMPVKQIARDFLIATSELVLGGEPVEPQAGDLIEERDGTVNKVLPVNGHCWKWSDTGKTQRRIHTKEV